MEKTDKKIKGKYYIYDLFPKLLLEFYGEAEVVYKIDECENICYYIPYAVIRCPYDDEEITMSIIFSDDFSEEEKENDTTQKCKHFFRGTGIINSVITNKIRGNLFYAEETSEEFANRMGWKKGWKSMPGGWYYVFCEKK